MQPNRLPVWLVAGIFLAGSTAVAVPAVQTASTRPWGISDLMHSLAQVTSASGRFSERKTMHMLSAPLVSSGTLTYIAPDHIKKITITPIRERFTLDGSQITITRGSGKKTHTFPLKDYPQIGGMVEGIRATLAGDLSALRLFYRVRLAGKPAHWTLVLRPNGSRLAHYVKKIRIIGVKNRIRKVETEESNGDRSVMRIVETVHDAP